MFDRSHRMLLVLPRILLLLVLVVPGVLGLGCGGGADPFVIISGSENQTLQPILDQFGRKNGVKIEMRYLGSVDIMVELQKDTPDFDAVWPASSLWVTMGDTQHYVKDMKSIMTSPVVFGIRLGLARELGFVGREVKVSDILGAIRAGKLTFMMTSASQSNSGASAYLGFLYALSGNPEVLTKQDLERPELVPEIRGLLAGINRSSGSSGWLKDLFLKGGYDAMVNYESLIIEANQQLIREGREPLYLVYPVDGLTLADSPLGYVNRGDAKKQAIFSKLQQYLLSDPVQKQILAQGRRTGLGGVLSGADPKVFNPDWGIETARILSLITLPPADVIQQALTLYQTTFRKPAYTVYCLDYSGSMAGEGERQLKAAMQLILDQTTAAGYTLQTGPDDRTMVVPFNQGIIAPWQASGNDPAVLADLLARITDLGPNGNTDIYSPAILGLETLAKETSGAYISSVVIMTDGQSNVGATYDDLARTWNSLGRDTPVFTIMFGDADQKQLDRIATLTRSRVFDGRTDLVGAFRAVKGYSN